MLLRWFFVVVEMVLHSSNGLCYSDGVMLVQKVLCCSDSFVVVKMVFCC